MTSKRVKDLYCEIQKQIFYMIPEKWDKVYLYFSILERPNNLETGELYFYYIPKGVLKKNPINVYQIPKRFNIDEEEYVKLVNKLYNTIKTLRNIHSEETLKIWNSVTILIGDFKFIVEYNYDEYIDSKYSSYDKHQIFRYKHLDIPLSSFNKKDRKMIEKYFYELSNYKPDTELYYEPMYKAPFKTITANSKESNIKYIKEDDLLRIEDKKEIISQILKSEV